MEPVVTSAALWQVILLFIGAAISFFSGWSLYLRKKDKDHLDKLGDKVNTLENKYVTEQRVRELIREELLPISNETHEIKATLNLIQTTLSQILIAQAEERGRRRAMDEDKSK